MQYDQYGSTRRTMPRRTLIRGTACLGLLGVYRAMVAPAAHTPGSIETVTTGPNDARPSTDSYRMRPLAGSARAPQSAPGVRRPATLRQQAHLTLSQPGRSIALTFDDGPHPVQTPAILDILRKHDVPATFFIIGQNASWHPDLVKAIDTEGHLIANHSWSHPQLNRIPTAKVRTELGRTCDLIEKALGASPRFARAPYGAWHKPSLKVCAALGMEPMGWSIDTQDWKSPGSATIRSRVLTGAAPGAIVLAHDGGGDRSQTVEALTHYLPRLLDRGYTMVPLTAPA